MAHAATSGRSYPSAVCSAGNRPSSPSSLRPAGRGSRRRCSDSPQHAGGQSEGAACRQDRAPGRPPRRRCADHLARFDCRPEAAAQITLPLAPGEAFDHDDMATLTLHVPAAAAGQPQRPAPNATRPQPTRSAGSSTSSSTIHQSKSERRKARIRARAESSRLPGSGARPSAWAAARTPPAPQSGKRGVADPDHLLRSKVLQNRGRQLAFAHPAGPDSTSGDARLSGGFQSLLLDLASLEATGQQWRRIGEEGVRHSHSGWPQHCIRDQVDPLLPSCSRRLDGRASSSPARVSAVRSVVG